MRPARLCAARFYRPPLACALLLCLPATVPLSADTPATPGVLFTQALPDVPGRNLVVVALDFAPAPAPAAGSQKCHAHRHPGSTYVYVTKGAVRLGIEGHPVQLVHAGESFFEPPYALHTVAENVSATEPAAAIAVMILPDGAPRVIPEDSCSRP
jgi:quercetin dioxygenase-like cupin family protein